VPISVGSSAEWEVNIGTIYLKRLENVLGTTISFTSLNAPRDARQAYEKAQKALAQQKVDDAVRELDKAVHIYPGFASAWSLMGDIHRQRGQLDSARLQYSQAVTADPQFVNPRYGLAMIAITEKKWREAADLTETVVRLNAPAFPAAYFFNAVASFNTDQLDIAERSARKYKELDVRNQHPDVRVILGNILALRKDFTGAAREMREYLAIAPNAPNAAAVRRDLELYERSSAVSETSKQ
jgi:Flp pilus assembly protein TadD